MMDKDGGEAIMPRTGRPKLEDPRTFRVSLRFSKEQRAVLEAYCEKHHLNKAQAMMKGFEELLRQDEEAEKKKKR